ncbi:Alpha/Beta hydrolase protein [Cyathus striatus]|nr:Alpha/Beta hydrolase protein [Cyathus striatus]
MSKTGTIEFKYKGKAYHTAYEVWGDLHCGKTPLVALHGGPGMSHHYMLIPVVIYDEIGNGNSSHALDEPEDFWTPEVFMDELQNLLQQLDISSSFDLLGHSWGGILASSYALRTPPGLKHLIIGTNELFARNFPSDLVSRTNELYESGLGESEDYKAGALHFYKKHLCALDPWPEELMESMKAATINPRVRKVMLGISTLHITGSLKNWSIINEIHKIRAPILLISSPDDEVQEEAIIPYFVNAKRIKWIEIPGTTHMPMFEDPERYFSAILAFLGGVH